MDNACPAIADHRRSKCVSFVDLANFPPQAEEAAQVKNQAAKIAERGRLGRWKVGPRYELQDCIGKGSYGCVCQAHDTERNRAVAIKRTSLAQFNHSGFDKRVLREVAILSAISTLQHENIVRMVDVVASLDAESNISDIYLVLECCDSDIGKLLATDVALTDIHIRRLLYTLLCGLEFLHASGIWHRDLKPANCLINKDCTVKLCDFGLSRGVWEVTHQHDEAQELRRHLTAHVATRWYRAPELILLQKLYTEAIDIWSVGCIYAELLGMLEGVKVQDRTPLFPGSYCFPLSPRAKTSSDARSSAHKTDEQLEVIFDVIGTPSLADVEKLDDERAKSFVRSFASRTGTGFQARVPTADDESRDFLTTVLQFNPTERTSATKLMEHRIFRQVKDKNRVRAAPICAHFAFESLKLDRLELKEYLRKEMRKFKPPEFASDRFLAC